MPHSIERIFGLLIAGCCLLSLAPACGDDDSSAADGSGAGSGGKSGGKNPFGNPTTPPTQVSRDGGGTFVQGDAGKACDKSLHLVIRDFTEDHPDFEHFTGNGLDGIVKNDLGSDQKPVYASDGPTAMTTGPDEFAQWYRDTPGVNQRIEVSIEFMQTQTGVYVYDNSMFFPIDGMGFGNGPNPSHNYLFTTEAHTVFTYKGGEVFTFRGDDDLWVFVNGKLAVDLGGLHTPLEESVDFDRDRAKLGIEVGKTYPMDIFHAERHTVESNFRIQTTIDLSCIQNIDVK